MGTYLGAWSGINKNRLGKQQLSQWYSYIWQWHMVSNTSASQMHKKLTYGQEIGLRKFQWFRQDLWETLTRGTQVNNCGILWPTDRLMTYSRGRTLQQTLGLRIMRKTLVQYFEINKIILKYNNKYNKNPIIIIKIRKKEKIPPIKNKRYTKDHQIRPLGSFTMRKINRREEYNYTSGSATKTLTLNKKNAKGERIHKSYNKTPNQKEKGTRNIHDTIKTAHTEKNSKHVGKNAIISKKRKNQINKLHIKLTRPWKSKRERENTNMKFRKYFKTLEEINETPNKERNYYTPHTRINRKLIKKSLQNLTKSLVLKDERIKEHKTRYIKIFCTQEKNESRHRDRSRLHFRMEGMWNSLEKMIQQKNQEENVQKQYITETNSSRFVLTTVYDTDLFSDVMERSHITDTNLFFLHLPNTGSILWNPSYSTGMIEKKEKKRTQWITRDKMKESPQTLQTDIALTVHQQAEGAQIISVNARLSFLDLLRNNMDLHRQGKYQKFEHDLTGIEGWSKAHLAVDSTLINSKRRRKYLAKHIHQTLARFLIRMIIKRKVNRKMIKMEEAFLSMVSQIISGQVFGLEYMTISLDVMLTEIDQIESNQVAKNEEKTRLNLLGFDISKNTLRMNKLHKTQKEWATSWEPGLELNWVTSQDTYISWELTYQTKKLPDQWPSTYVWLLQMGYAMLTPQPHSHHTFGQGNSRFKSRLYHCHTWTDYTQDQELTNYVTLSHANLWIGCIYGQKCKQDGVYNKLSCDKKSTLKNHYYSARKNTTTIEKTPSQTKNFCQLPGYNLSTYDSGTIGT